MSEGQIDSMLNTSSHNTIAIRADSAATVIEPRNRLGWPDFGELYRFRELLFILTLRDIKVRYKRAYIGLAWAFIQPLLTLFVFSMLFGRLAKLPSENLPYPVFAMAALLPWQLFSRSMTQASNSLISMQAMMTKTYFPRLIAPLAELLSCLPDFFIALGLLGLVMAWFGIMPGAAVLFLPILIFLVLLTSFAISLWLAALNIEYRDIQFALPFVVQLWMYATPVVYSITSVPDKWTWLIAINPMTLMVEGFRWSILGKPWALATTGVLISGLSIVLLLITGLRYFDRVQRTFADRI